MKKPPVCMGLMFCTMHTGGFWIGLKFFGGGRNEGKGDSDKKTKKRTRVRIGFS